jgi:hypothetical protein
MSSQWTQDLLARFGIPDMYGLVLGTGNEPSSISRKGQASDGCIVARGTIQETTPSTVFAIYD